MPSRAALDKWASQQLHVQGYNDPDTGKPEPAPQAPAQTAAPAQTTTPDATVTPPAAAPPASSKKRAR